MQRIVIVGGGFVGLHVVRHLRKYLQEDTVITLIDRNERFVFSPWLIDALAGKMDIPDYSASYTEMATRDGWRFAQGEAGMIDRETKQLDIVMPDGSKKAMTYDWLVVCPGSKTAYYGIPGAETHAYPLKTLADVKHIHERLADIVKQARVADDANASKLLRFLIVGGGPSGIESVFAIKRYLKHELLSDAPRLADKLHFTLVDGGKNILNGFNDKIVAGARKAVERQGVEIVNGDPAASVDADALVLKSGKKLEAGFILWCAGVSPNDMPSKPDLPRDVKNSLMCDSCLRLEQAIYGAGDAVTFMDESGKPASRTAQTAMQQANILADNVLRAISGKEPHAYHHHVKGFILTFGDTGYLDTPIGGLMFPTVVPLRHWFYRFRFWQMTGR
jgi:NADH dehydrogenase